MSRTASASSMKTPSMLCIASCRTQVIKSLGRSKAHFCLFVRHVQHSTHNLHVPSEPKTTERGSTESP
eukprot:749993-Hanusia_phi.AAC.2